jgi:hypothetical protein
MGGWERALATTFLWPGRCWKDALNSERKERWRCWREEKGVDCLLMVAKRGLWSVKGVQGWPSWKNLKCLTEGKAARSSLSKVE